MINHYFFEAKVPMNTTARALVCACALGLAILAGIFSPAAQAASINYGNFGPVPPGVSFLQVTESSGTDPIPLYGPPTAFSVGLDFNPVGFAATSSAGSAPDITEGQLNFTAIGIGGVGIGSLSVSESGDYTLAGIGTPATTASAGAILRATVTQIDFLPVAPINLAPVNASVSFALPGAAIVQPWSLGLSMNVAAQLIALGYAPGSAATRVEIVIDNSMVATSEAASVSFIAKKDFRFELTPVNVIPEPSSLTLAGLTLGGLYFARRKRS